MCDEQSTRIFGYVFLGPVEEPPESEIDHDGLRMELEVITTEVESQVTVKRLYEIIERECNYRVRLCKVTTEIALDPTWDLTKEITKFVMNYQFKEENMYDDRTSSAQIQFLGGITNLQAIAVKSDYARSDKFIFAQKAREIWLSDLFRAELRGQGITIAKELHYCPHVIDATLQSKDGSGNETDIILKFAKTDHESDVIQKLSPKSATNEITTLSPLENHIVDLITTLKAPKDLGFIIGTANCGISIKYKSPQENEMLNYALQLLKGVNFMHENNIAHGGIKADNIMVNSAGKLTIIDFGKSKDIKDRSTCKTVYKDIEGCSDVIKDMCLKRFDEVDPVPHDVKFLLALSTVIFEGDEGVLARVINKISTKLGK